jgi:hypothetical protein
MNKNHSFRKAFYHLKMALDYFEDTNRTVPATVGGKLSIRYAQRIKWIVNDFATSPKIPAYAADDFKDEMNSDIMFHEAISEKALNLDDKQKLILEGIIDELVKGATIDFADNKNQFP